MIQSHIKNGIKALISLFISLVFILTIAFIIKNSSNEYPDENRLYSEAGFADLTSAAQKRKQITRYGLRNGLNLPIFYFSIQPANFPKQIYSILPVRERKAVKSLLREGYPADLLLPLREKIINQLDTAPSNHAQFLVQFLRASTKSEIIQSLEQFEKNNIPIPPESLKLKNKYAHDIYPSFIWHGCQNQWHRAAKNFITGNWGSSKIDGQKVSTKIGSALPYTIILNGFAIVFLFISSIFIGSWWSQSKKTFWVKLTKQIAYFLYVMPLFWLAALAISFFTKPNGIFPLPSGLENQIDISHYLLPLTCIWLSSFGYLSRMFEDLLNKEWEKPYIKLGLHRGLSQKKLLKSYALPNAIVPVIALLGGALPALISGSLIIEVLFNIPGMGRLIWWSLQRQDWPVVVNIILLIAYFAWLGRWSADRLSQYLDPRMDWNIQR
ncbi:MAG: ABC transporter permease subunit [Bacteroidetes bacterium]|jgi:peptide/nickel transport system permease protein|nr:ABC transporter permease subunit [Bacteroidota bacterium]